MINTAGVRVPTRGLPHHPIDIVTQADPLGPRRPGCGVASGRRDVAEPLTPADSRERRLDSRFAAGATHKVEGERFIRHIVAGLKFLYDQTYRFFQPFNSRSLQTQGAGTLEHTRGGLISLVASMKMVHLGWNVR